MSHKRTASDAAGDSPTFALALGGLFADERHSDLAIHIGSFWTGRDFSTFAMALAAQSSKTDREDDHPTRLLKRILLCLAARCAGFLDSVGGPDSMKAILKDRAQDASDRLSAPQSCMRPLSEWCAFLDYCGTMPLRLSKARLEQDDPIRPIWIVGAGKFSLPGGESNAILSVPSQTWRPELIFLGEKWLVDCPKEQPMLDYSFFMDPGEEMAENIGHTAAVLSWDSGFYLAKIHKAVDIKAGMMVDHIFPINNLDDEEIDGCYLNWLSKSFCESMIGRYVRRGLEKSDLKWMAKGTEWDNNMLAAIEIDDTLIPHTHMDMFGERIVTLMNEVGRWCDEGDDSVDNSSSSN